MARIYPMIVESCLDCPECGCLYSFSEPDYRWCNKTNKDVLDYYNIPDWCPLPDKDGDTDVSSTR